MNNTKFKEVAIQGVNLRKSKSCVALVEEEDKYTLKTYQISELSLASARLINKISLPHNALVNALVKSTGISPWMQNTKCQFLYIASQIDWNVWLASDSPTASQFVNNCRTIQECPTDKMQAYWESKLI